MLQRPSPLKSQRATTSGGNGSRRTIGGRINPLPPPPPPLPGEGVGVGVGLGVSSGAGAATGSSKYKKPPRNINEGLVEIPDPAWPTLCSKRKPLEVARPPPVSI